MDALKTSSLAPISVLQDNRGEPKKPTSLVLRKCSSVSSSIKSLAIVSTYLATSGLAQALTYEEALQQSAGIQSSSFDGNGLIESIVNFGIENPIAIAGGVTLLAVPFFLSKIFSKPKPYGVESSRNAYGALGDDPSAQLLDIRPSVELRKVGTPDIRGLGKKLATIPYDGKDKPSFLKKLSLKFKDPEKTTLFILDKFDGDSEMVAELASVNGFKGAFAIRDGAEGPRGWMNSGLPWIPPKKASLLDLNTLTDSLADGFGEGVDAAGLGIGFAAAAGFAAISFAEIETILQLLGAIAFVQFTSKNLILAEDRSRTLKVIDEFISIKVAPQSLLSEIKEIGASLLPTVESKALPAPNEEAPAMVVAEMAREVSSQYEEAPAATNYSATLSPYSAYEDFKPPSSPSPSRP